MDGLCPGSWKRGTENSAAVDGDNMAAVLVKAGEEGGRRAVLERRGERRGSVELFGRFGEGSEELGSKETDECLDCLRVEAPSASTV